MTATASILIVDDDAALRRLLTDRLRFWGHAVTTAGSGEEAIPAARARAFDLVLLDLAMPGMSGQEALTRLREDGCGADIVVLTAHGSIERAVEAIRLGADDFLLKPADFDVLRRVIDRAIAKRRLERSRAALAEQHAADAGSMVVASPAMRDVVETARRAAWSDAGILILGESGTGKQLLAELIHGESPRAAGPFVYVNCVAISEELIESTLFGHEKGAFTGAVAQKTGRLEMAEGGTAFLDEIGDISSALQAKLLHFLESGEFERVGGTQTRSINCRIVAATNRDLRKNVEEGRFRQDLYYRLNVVTLAIPPLRDRRDDVPALAEAFLDRFARELKRDGLRFTGETMRRLREYAWPGNVRQLRNAVERMVVLARGRDLTPDLLPPEVLETSPSATGPLLELPYREATDAFRRRLIEHAMERTGGNHTRAAELLGIRRTYLHRLLSAAAREEQDEADADSDS